MLLSKTRIDDIDICLIPHCDISEISVNQLTKLNGHHEPVLLLTARSNSEYLLVRDLEELTFRQQTGLNVDISVLNRVQQENERLREENEQQQKRIAELESQLNDFITMGDEMKQLCKEYKKDMKKIIQKNDEYYRKFEYLGQKIDDHILDERNDQLSSRLKYE
jgi:septal ring factor EnvC (AmiA/AmiB activator)